MSSRIAQGGRGPWGGIFARANKRHDLRVEHTALGDVLELRSSLRPFASCRDRRPTTATIWDSVRRNREQLPRTLRRISRICLLFSHGSDRRKRPTILWLSSRGKQALFIRIGFKQTTARRKLKMLECFLLDLANSLFCDFVSATQCFQCHRGFVIQAKPTL